MQRFCTAFVFCLVGLMAVGAAPVLAQQSPARQAVAQWVFAQDLFAHARSQNDALAMLTAAKLAGAVDLHPVERAPETLGTATPDQPDAALGPLDAAAMLANARAMVDPDETLALLLAEAELGNTLVRAGTIRSTTATLAAGQTHIWKLPFDGGVLAELGLAGDGDGNLDLVVKGSNDSVICATAGSTDRASCDFIPPLSGYVTLTVNNAGPGTNTYVLVTN